MCQIQLVKALNYKALTKNDKVIFANLLYFGSASNKDAYGYFTKGLKVVSNTKYDFNSVYNDLLDVDTDFLVGHNRYETKGSKDNLINNHPFETDNFIIVHNGSISNDEYLKKMYNLEYNTETDSYVIISLLEYFYKEDKDLGSIIKKVAELLYGSYSVIVYHKESNRLFYFKNGSTRFSFALQRNGTKKTLFASTIEDNLTDLLGKEEMKFFSDKSNILVNNPEKDTVYEILNDEIKVLEVFKEKMINDRLEKDKLENQVTLFKDTDKSRTGIPDTLKGKLKQVGNAVDKVLLYGYEISTKNRYYDLDKGYVYFDLPFTLDASIMACIEEDLVFWGDSTFIEKNNKLMLKFDVDFSQLQDKEDWEKLNTVETRYYVCEKDFKTDRDGLWH